MTKPQLVSYISQQTGLTKKVAAQVISAVANIVSTSLQDEKGKIRISDLGTFRVVEISERRGVNPRTGEDMMIPAMRLPRFYASKALKELVKAD